MRRTLLTLFFTVGNIAFAGCESNNSSVLNHIPNGRYIGVFTVNYTNGNTYSNPVTVQFTDGNAYSSTGNPDYIPAGGNGTFEINGSKILFEADGFWTANFDWNLILNGAYDFSLNGTNLVISANKNNVGFYNYELTKE